jgi:hypothetical protein
LIPIVGDAVALDDEVVDMDTEVLLTELFDELETLVVDEATLLLLEEARDVKRYISSLFPAPQYS